MIVVFPVQVMKKQDATQPRVTKTKDINFPLHFPKSPEVSIALNICSYQSNYANYTSHIDVST